MIEKKLGCRNLSKGVNRKSYYLRMDGPSIKWLFILRMRDKQVLAASQHNKAQKGIKTPVF